MQGSEAIIFKVMFVKACNHVLETFHPSEQKLRYITFTQLGLQAAPEKSEITC